MTTCASSSTSSAPCRRHAAAISRSGATSPSMENTTSVTTMAGPVAAAHQALEVSHVAVAVDGHLGVRQAGPVDDRGVVELVRADAHAAVAEGVEHAQVGGEAGGEQRGALGGLRTAPGPSRAPRARGGCPARSRLAARARAPVVERLVGGGDHGRVQRQAEIVVGREGDDLATRLRPGPPAGPRPSKVTRAPPAVLRPTGAGCAPRPVTATGWRCGDRGSRRVHRRVSAVPACSAARPGARRICAPCSTAQPGCDCVLPPSITGPSLPAVVVPVQRQSRHGPGPPFALEPDTGPQTWERPRSTTPCRRRSISSGSTPPRWNAAADRASTSQASPPGTRLRLLVGGEDGAHGPLVARHDVGGQAARRGQELVVGDDMVDEPPLERGARRRRSSRWRSSPGPAGCRPPGAAAPSAPTGGGRPPGRGCRRSGPAPTPPGSRS